MVFVVILCYIVVTEHHFEIFIFFQIYFVALKGSYKDRG